MKKLICLVLMLAMLLAGCSVRVMEDGTAAPTAGQPEQPIGPLELDMVKPVNVIAASGEIFLALKADGTVHYTATPNEMTDLQMLEQTCKALEGWKDISSVAAGYTHLAGLKKDGTVVATGKNDMGQCNVQGWTDVVGIAAGMNYTAGVRKDGTLLFTGDSSGIGQIDENVTGVVAISGSDYMLMALLENGTVKLWSSKSGSTEGWTDVVQICAGHAGPAALKKDGTLLINGPEYLDNYKMDAWKGLVQIALRGNVVGLKADGSLIACGYDMDGQCHVGFWEDVVDIYSVSDVTVGVRKDGTLITTGGSTWNISQIDTWTGVLVADK